MQFLTSPIILKFYLQRQYPDTRISRTASHLHYCGQHLGQAMSSPAWVETAAAFLLFRTLPREPRPSCGQGLAQNGNPSRCFPCPGVSGGLAKVWKNEGPSPPAHSPCTIWPGLPHVSHTWAPWTPLGPCTPGHGAAGKAVRMNAAPHGLPAPEQGGLWSLPAARLYVSIQHQAVSDTCIAHDFKN